MKWFEKELKESYNTNWEDTVGLEEPLQVKVIKKVDGRIDRKTGNVYNERLRVCAYCRVSTDSEEQKNSYDSQLKY